MTPHKSWDQKSWEYTCWDDKGWDFLKSAIPHEVGIKKAGFFGADCIQPKVSLRALGQRRGGREPGEPRLQASDGFRGWGEESLASGFPWSSHGLHKGFPWVSPFARL